MKRDSATKDETSPRDKKKKKINSSSSSPAKTSTDIYAEIYQHEEEMALNQSGEEDLATFRSAVQEMKTSMKKILKLKTIKCDKQQDLEMEELRTATALKFLTLKRLNRAEKYRLRTARDTTNEAKQRVDTFHLQLQNLLYEIIHLKKEVSRCQQFKSKDEEIDLVSVKDFYAEAPTNISKPEQSETDAHVQYLARLEWELLQRKQMASQCQEQEKLKSEVAQQIQSKQEQLDSILPRLKTILAATKPLQDFLKMPIDEERAQHSLAYSLPEPLYVLYVQTSAYQQACDPQMTVTILGSQEEVDSFNRTAINMSVEESESEAEAEEQRGTEDRRNRRKSKQKTEEDHRERVLLPHPLRVHVEIRLKDGDAIAMELLYLPSLHIVLVKCRVIMTSPQTLSCGDLVAADSILACLFDDDLGDTSPNPASRYLLHRNGVDCITAHLPSVGKAYVWAQGLAGLDYLTSTRHEGQDTLKPNPAVSISNMEKTMKAIKKRLKSRIALQREISCLERCNLYLPAHLTKLFPSKTSSKLVSWQIVTWETYQCSSIANHLVSAGHVTSNHHLYRAVIERGTAKLEALVCVGLSYPQTAPVFALSVEFPSVYGCVSKDTVREMEAEVNLGVCELMENQDGLLSAQVEHLLVCLDIFCESQASLTAAHIQKENIFFRATRGRSHSRPFLYVPKLGLFTHP